MTTKTKQKIFKTLSIAFIALGIFHLFRGIFFPEYIYKYEYIILITVGIIATFTPRISEAFTQESNDEQQ